VLPSTGMKLRPACATPLMAALVKHVMASVWFVEIVRSSLLRNTVPETAQLINRLWFAFVLPAPENFMQSGSLYWYNRPLSHQPYVTDCISYAVWPMVVEVSQAMRRECPY